MHEPAAASTPVQSSTQKLRDAITGIERLYTVLNAFALTNGLKNIATEWADPSKPFPFDHFWLFVGLAATLIPFSHGAAQHLAIFHLDPNAKSSPKLFFFDYLMLLGEGLVFVMLAFMTTDVDRFFVLMALLLLVDSIFVIGTLVALRRRGQDTSTAVRWGALNIATTFAGLMLWQYVKTPLAIALGLTARTIVDYWLNWTFYFPETPSSSSAK